MSPNIQSKILENLILLISMVWILNPLHAQPSQSQIPRPEHPKPQYIREQWLNLNGEWDFAIDNTLSGKEKGWSKDAFDFDRKITVPFCPESELSGIGNTDFMNAVWYHRTFMLAEDWKGQRVFLNFGGVDYKCTSYVNGEEVGEHYGGSASFSFEISKALKVGVNELIVLAEDDIRSGVQPGGKQTKAYNNRGFSYTRTTGIWQTVWLEARPQSFLERVKVLPDVDNSGFIVTPEITDYRNGQTFKVSLLENGKVVSTASNTTIGVPVFLKVKKPKLWSPKIPFLYDLKFELLENGKAIDAVASYAGLRKVYIADGKYYLNNKPIFLRFVLDQGYYPNGIWTAPSDAALKKDIELAMKVGFNSARLHQKVFDERFHYWADKLGYLTMGEFADWDMVRSYTNPEGWANLTREWREVVMRDYNHPSIITWTPLNETYDIRDDYDAGVRADRDIYNLTKALDPSRPIYNASGFLHILTDVWSVHTYEQDSELFKKLFENIKRGNDKTQMFMNGWEWYGEVKEYDVTYGGQPYIVDEYGGTYWLPSFVDEEPRGSTRGVWGYGKTAEEVTQLISDLTKVLTDNPKIAGYTYTQLTDVFQETNGIYTFDRELKFPLEKIRKAFVQTAAIESE